MSSFEEGDIVYKIINGMIDDSSKFEIIKIKCEEGGNWHDGFTNYYNGLLKNIETKETHNFEIEFNSYITNYKRTFVVKVES